MWFISFGCSWFLLSSVSMGHYLFGNFPVGSLSLSLLLCFSLWSRHGGFYFVFSLFLLCCSLWYKHDGPSMGFSWQLLFVTFWLAKADQTGSPEPSVVNFLYFLLPIRHCRSNWGKVKLASQHLAFQTLNGVILLVPDYGWQRGGAGHWTHREPGGLHGKDVPPPHPADQGTR